MIAEYEKILRAAIEPLVKESESIIIRCIDSEETVEASRDVHFIIVCPDEELGKLIGRHGSIADSIRTVVNIKARDDHKRVHLKFQSFSEE